MQVDVGGFLLILVKNTNMLHVVNCIQGPIKKDQKTLSYLKVQLVQHFVASVS